MNHRINNLLVQVILNLELIERELPGDAPALRGYCAEALAAAGQIEAMLRAAPAVDPLPVPAKRLLLVDDEPNLGVSIAAGLRGRVEVTIARTVSEAIKLLASREFDLILCDLHLPDGSGSEVRAYAPHERFVFITGDTQAPLGDAQRLNKPFRLEQIEALLQLPKA